MRKKHFIALANALRKERPQPGLDTEDEYRQWNRDVLAVSDTCRQQCPEFRLDKFMAEVMKEE